MDALVGDLLGGGAFDFLEKLGVVNAGEVDPKAGAVGQLLDAFVVEVFFDVGFDFELGGLVELVLVYAEEVYVAALFAVRLDIAQEVDLLKGAGHRLEVLIFAPYPRRGGVRPSG